MTEWHWDVEPWCTRVEAAAERLFANSEWWPRIHSITSSLRQDVRRLVERGADSTPTLVVIGSLGQGKSWLARCFLTSDRDNESLRGELRTGQNHDDRTESVTWFGPSPPPGLNALSAWSSELTPAVETTSASTASASSAALRTNERFWLVPQSRLLDLGRPYVVADTPGHSDLDAPRRSLAGTVGAAATIKLLVCSFAQVRDGGLARWIADLDGSVILPVIRYRPAVAKSSESSSSVAAAVSSVGAAVSVGEPTATQRADVQRELEQWRRLAPQVQWLEPCFMPDLDLFGEDAARQLVQARLQQTLTPALGRVAQLREATERQLRHRWQVAQQQLAITLLPFRQRVLAPIEQLETLTHHLPERLLAELVGEEDEVRLALRPRLRADWIERTPSICFPYRSLLGLLAITAGAWDRLALSLIGSLPSLVLTALQAARNARDFTLASRQLLAGLSERVERLLRDEFRGAIRQFRVAVSASLPVDLAASERALRAEASVAGVRGSGVPVAGELVAGALGGAAAGDLAVRPDTAAAHGEADGIRIVGLEGAEADSRRILQEVVRARRSLTSVVYAFAWLATGCFLFLLTGPLVALYRAYLIAHHDALLAGASQWQEFPAPTGGMLLSSLVLSVLPVFVVALGALTWCCRAARVRVAAVDIRQRHRDALQQRFESGALRIELTDPQLDAARQLLALTKPPAS
ncbi:MAG: hypothetical protein ACKOU6_10025 [Planctomycetota bacterium]